MKTNPCRYCKGTARITFRHPTRDAICGHECTSCNGTGIDGNPRWAIGIMLLSVVVGLAVIAWAFMGA